jgi:hypothetical protein
VHLLHAEEGVDFVPTTSSSLKRCSSGQLSVKPDPQGEADRGNPGPQGFIPFLEKLSAIEDLKEISLTTNESSQELLQTSSVAASAASM